MSNYPDAQTTYYLTKPNFASWLTQPYATHINLILRSYLNYKKLPKCINTINFLRINFSYKRAETALIPSTYIFLT